MKYDGLAATLDLAVGRSREGAWIEMLGSNSHFHNGPVAPARERGLKYISSPFLIFKLCRSREGAWIEICGGAATAASAAGRSREGAWIEIKAMVGHALLLGCRSREGAWIEIERA